jgi:hypothetical protein
VLASGSGAEPAELWAFLSPWCRRHPDGLAGPGDRGCGRSPPRPVTMPPPGRGAGEACGRWRVICTMEADRDLGRTSSDQRAAIQARPSGHSGDWRRGRWAAGRPRVSGPGGCIPALDHSTGVACNAGANGDSPVRIAEVRPFRAPVRAGVSPTGWRRRRCRCLQHANAPSHGPGDAGDGSTTGSIRWHRLSTSTIRGLAW